MREMRLCANPGCRKMIERIKRTGNHSGENEYCSSECWSAFSPEMRKVCLDNLKDVGKKGLRALIEELRREGKTRTDIANIFGITSKTLRVWAEKVGIKHL